MTLFEFAPTVAGTRIIAAHTGENTFHNSHHLRCFTLAPDESSHELHGKINMVEKIFEAGAKIIEAGIPIWRQDEAIFGAFAVAGKTHVTIQAILRQCVQFVLTKFQSAWARRPTRSCDLSWILPSRVVGLNEMVAGIKVAVVLDG